MHERIIHSVLPQGRTVQKGGSNTSNPPSKSRSAFILHHIKMYLKITWHFSDASRLSWRSYIVHILRKYYPITKKAKQDRLPFSLCSDNFGNYLTPITLGSHDPNYSAPFPITLLLFPIILLLSTITLLHSPIVLIPNNAAFVKLSYCFLQLAMEAENKIPIVMYLIQRCNNYLVATPATRFLYSVVGNCSLTKAKWLKILL